MIQLPLRLNIPYRHTVHTHTTYTFLHPVAFLTCFVVVRVVVGYVAAEELSPGSSHEPVDVGVPLIAVSAQMRLLEVALWTGKEQDRMNRHQSRSAGRGQTDAL